MKRRLCGESKGSALLISMFTITILTLICATSLYITSQNTTTGMQIGAWQQSLTAAESGVDTAVRALNTGVWTGWYTVNSSTLPTVEPTGGSAATGVPSSGQYNYYPSASLTMSMQGEGAATTSTWVTVDTANGLQDATGNWYRVRSTGQTTFASTSVLTRVTNNRLDNALRNSIAMHFNRKSGSNLGPTRTIEVVMQPIPHGGSARGITLANWLVMSGGGSADSFNSPTHQWAASYRDTTYPLLVQEGATGTQAKFNQNNVNYVYGGLTYNGNPPGNMNSTTVLGQKSTPDNAEIPTPVNPTQVSSKNISWTYQNPWYGGSSPWSDSSSLDASSYAWTSNGGTDNGTFPPTAGTYATLNGGGGLPANGNSTISSFTANGTAASPALVVINGDFTVPGGTTFTINPTTTGSPPAVSPNNSYLIVWIKGKFTTSGSGVISQASGTHVAWIAENDITVSGNSYNNQNGTAASDTFIGTGNNNNKLTDSGSATFTGTVNAPAYSGTISGSGDFTGAIVNSNLTISGSGSFHYDESLNSGSNPSIGNYAFASWFEDNSDPTRKDVNGNYIVY
jgi:hypothetical protein